MLISPSSGVSTDSLFNAAKPSLFTANLTYFFTFFSLPSYLQVEAGAVTWATSHKQETGDLLHFE